MPNQCSVAKFVAILIPALITFAGTGVWWVGWIKTLEGFDDNGQTTDLYSVGVPVSFASLASFVAVFGSYFKAARILAFGLCVIAISWMYTIGNGYALCAFDSECLTATEMLWLLIGFGITVVGQFLLLIILSVITTRKQSKTYGEYHSLDTV